MFDDLVNKNNKKTIIDNTGKTATKTITTRDILRWLKEEFEDVNKKHLTKATSTDAYCNELEAIIIRAFVRAGHTGHIKS